MHFVAVARLESYFSEQEDEVRLRPTCKLAAMRQDQLFLNQLSLSFDHYDVYVRYDLKPYPTKRSQRRVIRAASCSRGRIGFVCLFDLQAQFSGQFRQPAFHQRRAEPGIPGKVSICRAPTRSGIASPPIFIGQGVADFRVVDGGNQVVEGRQPPRAGSTIEQ